MDKRTSRKVARQERQRVHRNRKRQQLRKGERGRAEKNRREAIRVQERELKQKLALARTDAGKVSGKEVKP